MHSPKPSQGKWLPHWHNQQCSTLVCREVPKLADCWEAAAGTTAADGTWEGPGATVAKLGVTLRGR